MLQGSARVQGGSYEGGPYSDGCFGRVKVEGDGRKVALEFAGRNHLDEVLLKHRLFEV